MKDKNLSLLSRGYFMQFENDWSFKWAFLRWFLFIGKFVGQGYVLFNNRGSETYFKWILFIFTISTSV